MAIILLKKEATSSRVSFRVKIVYVWIRLLWAKERVWSLVPNNKLADPSLITTKSNSRIWPRAERVPNTSTMKLSLVRSTSRFLILVAARIKLSNLRLCLEIKIINNTKANNSWYSKMMAIGRVRRVFPAEAVFLVKIKIFCHPKSTKVRRLVLLIGPKLSKVGRLLLLLKKSWLSATITARDSSDQQPICRSVRNKVRIPKT